MALPSSCTLKLRTQSLLMECVWEFQSAACLSLGPRSGWSSEVEGLQLEKTLRMDAAMTTRAPQCNSITSSSYRSSNNNNGSATPDSPVSDEVCSDHTSCNVDDNSSTWNQQLLVSPSWSFLSKSAPTL